MDTDGGDRRSIKVNFCTAFVGAYGFAANCSQYSMGVTSQRALGLRGRDVNTVALQPPTAVLRALAGQLQAIRIQTLITTGKFLHAV